MERKRGVYTATTPEAKVADQVRPANGMNICFPDGVSPIGMNELTATHMRSSEMVLGEWGLGVGVQLAENFCGSVRFRFWGACCGIGSRRVMTVHCGLLTLIFSYPVFNQVVLYLGRCGSLTPHAGLTNRLMQ